jgi:hypothetical protein
MYAKSSSATNSLFFAVKKTRTVNAAEKNAHNSRLPESFFFT